jgi:hypothetical protein
MKHNHKQMDKQLAELDRVFRPTCPPGVQFREPLGKAKRDGLAAGERIVEDYFDGADGETVIRTERITAIDSDEGYDYPHGTWDTTRLDTIMRSSFRIAGLRWKTNRRSSRIAPTASVPKSGRPTIPIQPNGKANSQKKDAMKSPKRGIYPGMAEAEEIAVKEVGNKPILTLDQILDEENRVWALGEIPAVECQAGDDLVLKESVQQA